MIALHAAHPSDILATLSQRAANSRRVLARRPPRHRPARALHHRPAARTPCSTLRDCSRPPPRGSSPSRTTSAASWNPASAPDRATITPFGPASSRLAFNDARPRPPPPPHAPQAPGTFRLADFHPDDPAFVAGVRRIIEYIRAGDVYQANLAHRLSAPFSGSARALFHTWARAVSPLLGAYLEFDLASTRCAILSASPELFLSFDAHSRRVTTRPMKGTRPGTADPAELERSDKDAAELNMIVDLMRNDLGRVCSLGSVRVDVPRAIERHGPSSRGVLQATSTISGDLRPGLDLADLLAATFPPGSVTGAPKVRAMQIIDELEPVSRGPYCGAIGLIRPDGSAEFAVTIRTALIQGTPGPHPGTFSHATLDYSVGAGIVADSDPDSEWQETLVKAAGFFAAAGCPQQPSA